MSNQDNANEIVGAFFLVTWHLLRAIFHGLLLLLHIHPGEQRAGKQARGRSAKTNHVRAPWE